MIHLSQISSNAKKGLCLLVLGIMVWQQWSTLLSRQHQFFNPIQYTKQTYGNDYYSLYGNRFTEIKNFFPHPTHLNYVGEANEEFGYSEGYFALTQYYMVPNLLYRNSKIYDTIIYNLYNTIHIDPATNFHLNNGWHIVKDFNNGLIILAK